MVFNVYNIDTRKRQTRTSMSNKGSVRIFITNDTLVFKKTNQVMSVGGNKMELFTMFAESVTNGFKGNCTVTKCEAIRCKSTQRRVFCCYSMVLSHVWSHFMLLYKLQLVVITWGLSKDKNRMLNPIWTTLLNAFDACKELKHCNCKKHYSNYGKCKCKEYSLPCYELCCWGRNCI